MRRYDLGHNLGHDLGHDKDFTVDEIINLRNIIANQDAIILEMIDTHNRILADILNIDRAIGEVVKDLIISSGAIITAIDDNR